MRKGISIILIIICAIVFGVSAYQLISYYSSAKAAEKEFTNLLPEGLGDADAASGENGGIGYEEMLPYYKGLREENNDMVGWLRIPGTRISYPVMQTPSAPEFYLRKNFKKEFEMNGCLFASHISDVELPSDVVLIYGHRMRSGTMFGSLGDLLKEEFLDEHDTIIFDTFVRRNEYKIYCLFSEQVETGSEFDYYNYVNFGVQEAFDMFMSNMKPHISISLPENEPKFGDKILLLSTCEYTHENGRLVVVAVRQ